MVSNCVWKYDALIAWIDYPANRQINGNLRMMPVACDFGKKLTWEVNQTTTNCNPCWDILPIVCLEEAKGYVKFLWAWSKYSSWDN